LVQAERERIERALAELGGATDSDAPDVSDPADRGSDLYQDEFDQSLAETLRDELDAVQRAEERLANSTYGLSVESGEPIPDERLEALPTAELTVDEERRRA
jgi:DnaK suppressor protein